ncbi:MAG: TolC family protein [Opitutales bacterium]|nr:TolC family protein [Opitutales bacterium]MCH8541896.1 TolC family protein [Opitutales bacterium]
MNRVRYNMVLMASVMILWGSGANAPAEEIELTLAEALQRVEEDNFSLLINREAIQQAIAATTRERSALLPQVNLEATQTRSRFVGSGGNAFSGAGGQPTGGGSTERNRFEAGVTGSISLLDPQRIATYQASRIGIEVAELEFESLRQEVLNLVAEAYLDLVLARQRLEVFQANVERSEGFLELARNRVDAGVAAQIDLTRAEVQLAQDEQALIEQENTVFVRETAVKRLLTIPQDKSIAARPFRTRIQEAPDLNYEFTPQMFADRSEYQQILQNLEQNRLEVRAARWERLPSVRLFGNLGLVSETPFDGDEEEEWTVGIGASMPIFEGFRIRANTMLANSRLRATQSQMRDLKEEIESEYMLVWRDLKARLAQIEVAEKTYSLAEEELSLAEVRFEEGVADNRDLIDAQNNLAQADDNRLDAYNRYDRGRLELARVRGDVLLILADQVVLNEE